MKLQILVVALLFVSSVALGSWVTPEEVNEDEVKRRPCMLPKQFMSKVRTVAHDENDCINFYDYGELYFDYPNQHIRLDMKTYMGDSMHDITVWMDFDEGISYYFKRDDKTCQTKQLKDKLKEPIIPKDATFRGTALIGSQALHKWMIYPEDNPLHMTEMVAVTEGTCFLVWELGYNSTNSSLYIDEDHSHHMDISSYMQTFYDFVPDVPPFFFDLPDTCKTARAAHRRRPLFARPLPNHFNFKRVAIPFNGYPLADD